jgi:hypothetical protein
MAEKPVIARAEEITCMVSKTVLGQETAKEKTLKVRLFKTAPSRVTVHMGRTINMGNYESARIDVEINCPCYTEEALDVYQEVRATVEELVAQEVTSIEDTIRGGLGS